MLETGDYVKSRHLVASPFAPLWKIVDYDSHECVLEDETGFRIIIKTGQLMYDFIKIDSKKADLCNHVWKNYIGFTESYKYCETCGEKNHV